MTSRLMPFCYAQKHSGIYRTKTESGRKKRENDEERKKRIGRDEGHKSNERKEERQQKRNENGGKTESCMDGEETKAVDQRMIASVSVFVTLSCRVNYTYLSL